MWALLALAWAVIQIGLGLGQLLIHFRSGDFGQQSAFFHAGADIEVPMGQIAGGARVDGRISLGGHVAGQHKVVYRRAWLGRRRR